MSIITDDMFQKGLHVLFSMYGNNDILFRKSEYYIENPLYRYRSNLEYALEEIKTEEVHLCSPSHFNDPFDSSYEISTSALLNEEFSIDFLLQITSSLFEIRKIDLQKIWSSHSPISIDSQISVHNFMQTIGSDARVPFHVLKARLLPFLASDIPQSSYGYKVACFSEILDSLPMWSYYADEHRGICLKYDIPHLREEVTYEHELRHAFSKVHYSNFRPQNSCGEYSLIVKSSQWSHEYECPIKILSPFHASRLYIWEYDLIGPISTLLFLQSKLMEEILNYMYVRHSNKLTDFATERLLFKAIKIYF